MPDLPVSAPKEEVAVVEPVPRSGEKEPEPKTREPEIPRIEITGLLDIGPRDSGHLRLLANNFLPRATDVRVPFGLIDRYKLREGHTIL
ncbi:MAG: hypothetical protein OXE58_04870, partial [Acidobacteria bacterium]|nr:hypothetical protein [Acidobacteriota bacterium]